MYSSYCSSSTKSSIVGRHRKQQHFLLCIILSILSMNSSTAIVMRIPQTVDTTSSSTTTTTTTTMKTTNKNGSTVSSSPYPEIELTTKEDGLQVMYKTDITKNNETSITRTILSVPTKLNYVTSDTIRGDIWRDISGSDSTLEGITWEQIPVPIYNAYCKQDRPTLDKHGYELLDDTSIFDDDDDDETGTSRSYIDFMDVKSVVDLYYPHCENIIRQHILKNSKTSSSTKKKQKIIVKAYDHYVRKSKKESNDESLKGSAVGRKVLSPGGVVHVDYHNESAPRRLQHLAEPPRVNDVLKDKLGSCPLLDPKLVQDVLDGHEDDDDEGGNNKKRKRYAFINVWRSIDMKHPIQQYPLALMNVKSLSSTKSEMKILDTHYVDRTSGSYLCSYHPNHEWEYFPNMTHKQILLLKQWDSLGSFSLSLNNNNNNRKEQYENCKSKDQEHFTTKYNMIQPNYNNNNNNEDISTFSFHTAFADPTSPKNAKPRQSIEVRCAIIWDDDDDDNNNNNNDNNNDTERH